MRTGCIFTLKNEEELIAYNMLYHRYIGVTDFFVFLDNSTDNTKNILSSMPDTRVFENLSYDELLPYSLGKPELDHDLIKEKFSAHNGVRQILHANMALDICRKEGIDFLIHIDPDELICLNLDVVKKGSLKNYLENLPDSAGAVIFENIESVPVEIAPAFPFGDILFKNTLSGDESFNHLPKTAVPDPYTGEMVQTGWFWGHTSGKLAVRVTPESYFSHFVHSFHSNGKIIKEKYLLHYNILNFRHFLVKYKNFKDFPQFTSFGHKVRPLRTLFVRLANDPQKTGEELIEYYKNHIMYNNLDIQIIKKELTAPFLEINAVSSFFRRAVKV
jgi:hypothetical protein